MGVYRFYGWISDGPGRWHAPRGRYAAVRIESKLWHLMDGERQLGRFSGLIPAIVASRNPVALRSDLCRQAPCRRKRTTESSLCARHLQLAGKARARKEKERRRAMVRAAVMRLG